MSSKKRRGSSNAAAAAAAGRYSYSEREANMAAAAVPGPTELFGNVSAMLDIQVKGGAAEEGGASTENTVAAPEETLEKCEFEPAELYDEDADEHTPLTEEQYSAAAFVGDSITLKGYKLVRSFPAPGSKGHFTVRELLGTIAAFSGEDRLAEVPERKAKGMGLDTWHTCFEGLSQEEGGVWVMSFGS